MAVSVVGSIGKEHYLTKITAGKNSMISDEPLWNGGTAMGMNPFELLASSLAACTCATLRMYIDRKGWVVDEIRAEVDLERALNGESTALERRIMLTGELTEEQRDRLLSIANSCPVHKILTHRITVNTQLV